MHPSHHAIAVDVAIIEAQGDLAICVSASAQSGLPFVNWDKESFIACDVACDEAGLQIGLLSQTGAEIGMDLTTLDMGVQQRLLFLLDGPGVPLFFVDAQKSSAITPVGVIWRGRFESARS